MRIVALALALGGLAACSGGSTTPPAVGDPAFDGTAGTLPLGAGGVRFVADVNGADPVTITADLLPGTTALSTPTTGSATMEGTFALFHITDVVVGSAGRTATATVEEVTGHMTLDASFADQTVTGGGDGLAITGTITGEGEAGRMAGTATYAGASGRMEGIIGADAALGIMWTQTVRTGTDALTGGFAVTAN